MVEIRRISANRLPVQGVQLPRVNVGAAGADERALAGAMVTLAQAGFRAGEEYRARQRQVQADELMAEANQQLGDWMTEARLDDEPDTLQDRFEAFANDLGTRLGERAADDTVRRVFASNFLRARTTNYVQAGALALELGRDHRVADLTRSLHEYAVMAAAAPNPLERQRLLTDAQVAIADMAEAGWIGEEQAAELEMTFRADSREAELIRMIATDPEQARLHLADPLAVADLDPVRAAGLFAQANRAAEAAMRQRVADARAAQAAAERALGIEDDRAYQETLAALQFGLRDVPLEEVLSWQGRATNSDFRILMNYYEERNNGITDPEEFRRLAHVVTDTPQAALSQLSAAAEARDLSLDDFMMLRTRALSNMESGVPTVERQVLASIEQALTSPSSIVPDPMENQRIAAATQEMLIWLEENPDLGTAEMRAQAGEIIDRYLPVSRLNPAQRVDYLPQPPTGTIPRGAPVQTQFEALGRAVEAFRADERAGAYGDQTRLLYMEQFTSWHRALEDRAAAEGVTLTPPAPAAPAAAPAPAPAGVPAPAEMPPATIEPAPRTAPQQVPERPPTEMPFRFQQEDLPEGLGQVPEPAPAPRVEPRDDEVNGP